MDPIVPIEVCEGMPLSHGGTKEHPPASRKFQVRQQERPTWRLPYFALRRRVSEMKRGGVEGLRITYERDGETRHVANAESDPELSSVPHLPNKFLLMRAIQDTDRGFCMW